jgi:chromate reductase, NAD(P)H dehydrogenase (quinone)
MDSGTINLLAISGSLREASTNTALLRAAMLLAPAGMTIRLYDGLARLPHFNPDLDVAPLPSTVADLREQVAVADGLLISSPEYARGVPGSLKNALDWLVSSDVFPGKPVAFLHASARGVVSQAALRLILETMSARLIDEASITVPLLGTQTDARAIVDDSTMAEKIRGALEAFASALIDA